MESELTCVQTLPGSVRTALFNGEVDVVRSVLDDLPALIALTDASGRIEFVNRRVLEYFGQSFGELKDWVNGGVIHPGDLPGVLEARARALESGEPLDMECRFRRGDGRYRWFHVRASPRRDADGRIVHWRVVSLDIDDRKRAETELASAKQLLEMIASDRPLPDVLRASCQALGKRRSDLAHVAGVTRLGMLTASIAHEVNQPLSGVVTNASTCLRMLASEPPNVDGAREIARRIIRDGYRASDVITRLRALFARKPPAAEPVDLNEATREVIALSRSELERGRVMIRLELAEELPLVMGDRVQLQQVIINLLRNACEAMHEVNDRPREIVITTARDADEGDGDRVCLSVRDSGVGLEPHGAEKLFDACYSTKQDGMGIGLSVSRSIIENHRGRLWAVPNEGPGVTFAFSMPFRPRHAQEDDGWDDAGSAPAATARARLRLDREGCSTRRAPWSPRSHLVPVEGALDHPNVNA